MDRRTRKSLRPDVLLLALLAAAAGSGWSLGSCSQARAARPSSEEIVAADPEHILLAWTGVAARKVRPELVQRRPGWERITAVQEGRIHVMEEGLFCRPFPRLVEGLKHLGRRIHPGLLETCPQTGDRSGGRET